jgi:hypothetical protein
MAEHLKPMALRQQDQIGDGFRNECRGLIRPAIAARFIGARVPIFASGCAAPPVAFLLGQELHPTLSLFKKMFSFQTATMGRILQLF